MIQQDIFRGQPLGIGGGGLASYIWGIFPQWSLPQQKRSTSSSIIGKTDNFIDPSMGKMLWALGIVIKNKLSYVYT